MSRKQMRTDRGPNLENVTVALQDGQYIGKTDSGLVCFPCTNSQCCPGFVPDEGRAIYRLEKRQKPGKTTNYGIFHDIRTRRTDFVDFEPPQKGELCVYPIGAIDQVGGAFLFVNFPHALLVDCGAIVKTQDFDTDYGQVKTEVLRYLPGLYELISTYRLRLEGIFLTHGHLDHIGAVPFLDSIDNLDGRTIDRVPIFSSAITYQYLLKVLNAAAENAEKNGEDPDVFSAPRINPFNPNIDEATRKDYSKCIIDMDDGEFKPRLAKTFQFGDAFTVKCIPINHSIPGAYGFVIEAQGKRWFYTGDSKLCGYDEASCRASVAAYSELGELDGIIIDALGIEKEEMTPPEGKIIQTYREILGDHQYETIYFLSFGSNIARTTEVRRLCAEPEIQRTVHWAGRAQRESFVIATHYHPPAKNVPVPRGIQGKLVIGTGAQFEQYSFGWLLAHQGEFGDYRESKEDFDPQRGATSLAIVASRPIPNNEQAVKSGVLALLERGVDVVMDRQAIEELELSSRDTLGTLYAAPVHVSGHGGKQDIKGTLEATNPRIVVPTHCESKDIPRFQEFVRSLNLQVVVPELGQYLK